MSLPTLRLICLPVLLAGLFSIRAWAVDIPVFASAATFNQVSWHPDRPGRELGWDEKYLLSAGIDSLRVAKFGLDMEIRTEESLDCLRPVLKTFLLSWNNGPQWVSMGSQVIGIGEAYSFAHRFVSHYAYDAYLFEPARFNALAYGYHRGMLSMEAALGGNQISRGMLKTDFTLKPHGQELSTGIRATVSDARWHSPSLIVNLGWKLDLEKFSHRTDLMWKQVLAHKDQPARKESAFATEFCYQMLTSTGFSVGGTFAEHEFAPRRKSEFYASIHHVLGKISISPGYSSIRMDTEHEDSFNALIGWELNRDFTLGFCYEYGFGPAEDTRHGFAIQTDLRVNF